jgi:hypothetical protein
MSKIYHLNYSWPDMGRKIPDVVQLKIINIYSKWADLMYLNSKNNYLTYISTLPIELIRAEDLK